MLSEAKPIDEAKFAAEPEPMPLAQAEQNTEQGAMSDPVAEAKGYPIEVEVQDGHRRGIRIASIFGRRQ